MSTTGLYVKLMDTQGDILEERLNSFLNQLQGEYGILEKLVYKNKNQHRRCSYFQYLLKVRRDLRLLQLANLEDILSSCFIVITEKKPRQKIHLLESLKKRKCDGGKHNFLDRLLGAARLLSQMVEPMFKGATEISTLLARSYFMGFSLTVLALLARLRVLVQQILVEIVSVFNLVSTLSQTKQSIKINQDGIEVFREYYPITEEIMFLECVWDTDKFIIVETMKRNEINNRDSDHREDAPVESSVVQYQSIEILLGDDETSFGKADVDTNIVKEASAQLQQDMDDAVAEPFIDSKEEKKPQNSMHMEEEENPDITQSPSKRLFANSNLTTISNSSVRKVAFLSVKRPAPSTPEVSLFNVNKKSKVELSENKEDPFFSLLTCGGNPKKSLI